VAIWAAGIDQTDPPVRTAPCGAVVVGRAGRGPAVLAFDSSTQFFDLQAGDQLITRKHARGATILTCGPVHRLAEPF